jgi:hypothetical protein
MANDRFSHAPCNPGCVWFNRPLPALAGQFAGQVAGSLRIVGLNERRSPPRTSPPQRKQSCGSLRAEEFLIALRGWIYYVHAVPRQSALWFERAGSTCTLRLLRECGWGRSSEARLTRCCWPEGVPARFPVSNRNPRPPSPRRPLHSHIKERSHEQSSKSPQDQLH